MRNPTKMLDPDDIKKLTEYQLEVFKDVFVTKEEWRDSDAKIDRLLTVMDAVLTDKQVRDTEVILLTHRMKAAEDLLDAAAPQLGLTFKH